MLSFQFVSVDIVLKKNVLKIGELEKVTTASFCF